MPAPTKPESEKVVDTRVSLPPTHKAKFLELGGSRWLRAKVEIEMRRRKPKEKDVNVLSLYRVRRNGETMCDVHAYTPAIAIGIVKQSVKEALWQGLWEAQELK